MNIQGFPLHPSICLYIQASGLCMGLILRQATLDSVGYLQEHKLAETLEKTHQYMPSIGQIGFLGPIARPFGAFPKVVLT